MFYLQVPDIDVPILDIEDSAVARLKHFATYGKLSDKPKYVEYLRNSTLLDYAGFLCLRFDINWWKSILGIYNSPVHVAVYLEYCFVARALLWGLHNIHMARFLKVKFLTIHFTSHTSTIYSTSVTYY